MAGQRVPEWHEGVTSFGQWFRLRRRQFLTSCCDCGLVHEVQVKPQSRGLLIRFIRDNNRTRAMRQRRRRQQATR